MTLSDLPVPQKIDANIICLHGDEEVAIQRAVQSFIEELQKSNMADLNLSRLDGRSLPQEELHNHLHLLPFGTERRLVILSHALAQVKSEAERDAFTKLLENLPPTTQWVLVIPDSQHYKKGKKTWEVWDKENWLSGWITNHKDRVEVLDFPAPSVREMKDWVEEEARRQGGRFDARAAVELANALGNDTLLVSQEINKLLTYTGDDRAVTAEDVRALSIPVDREDIFAMTDAMAQGDASTALRFLGISLQRQPENMLFASILRHFRQLLIAAEIMTEGGNANMIRQELGVMEFVAEKLVRQVRRFSLPQLEEIYQRLNDLDMQMKDGRTPPDLALELFVAELARR